MSDHTERNRALDDALRIARRPPSLGSRERGDRMSVADRPSVTDDARAETTTDDATQRLARAAYAVDSKHHFHEGQDGRPACSCGFVGDARKRTQTEHITAAVLEEYDHD